jgi:hypothetical protein
LQEIDPQGRPLYAALTADALMSGRDIREWDQDRLLRDVLAREQQTWKSNGVDERYQNLLALATLVGGDTEKILETSTGGNLALPSFREFDRGVYGAMTACAADGDDVPPLKPDLVGEFFVLEHVRGRNERVTASRAAELLNAAWTIRGGTKTSDFFGVGQYVSPSVLILFLTQLVEDFPDHPSTRHFLRKPAVPAADLRYWATMVSLAIRNYAFRGDFEAGFALFQELRALGAGELRRAGAAGGFIRANLYLLPLLLQEKRDSDAQEIVRAVQKMIHDGAPSDERHDFAEAAQETTLLLFLQRQQPMAETLIEQQAALIRQHPDDTDLRLPYAKSLSAAVGMEWLELSYRERLLTRLKDFCKNQAQDVLLYVTLARAALALYKEYVSSHERLDDAESMNALIRGLYKARASTSVSRYPDALNPFKVEAVEDDLREIALCLAESNAGRVSALTRAGRFRDASDLIGEIDWVSRRHKNDVEFARRWSWAVMADAEAQAEQGAVAQVTKAVKVLGQIATHYRDHAAEFRGYASTLLLSVVRKKKDIPTTVEMLVLLAECASATDAGPETIADYAEGAITVCQLQEAENRLAESHVTARQAAWAIRSDAYLKRVRGGTDEAQVQHLVEWLGTVEAAGQE